MKSQSPKEKLDLGKQDSLEDLHRYSFTNLLTLAFMESCPWSSLSTVMLLFPTKLLTKSVIKELVPDATELLSFPFLP